MIKKRPLSGRKCVSQRGKENWGFVSIPFYTCTEHYTMGKDSNLWLKESFILPLGRENEKETSLSLSLSFSIYIYIYKNIPPTKYNIFHIDKESYEFLLNYVEAGAETLHVLSQVIYEISLHKTLSLNTFIGQTPIHIRLLQLVF
jgi:hypothetical protein